MSVDELEPGMTGYGLTVFAGSRIDTFQVEILGVRQNDSWPQWDLIWGRLQGGPLESTGIPRGASGSPVYVDDRLIGAVGYGFSYSDEPLAGITPISQMLEAFEDRRAEPRHGSMVPPTIYASLQEALEGGRYVDPKLLSLLTNDPAFPVPAGAAVHSGMVPLAIPLMISGVGRGIFDVVSPVLEHKGFLPLLAGGAALSEMESPELAPGSGVGIQFMRGDLNMYSYGTLTYRKGDDILAFGHPSMFRGSIDWPMTTIDVHFVVPHLINSFKYASAVDIVGTVTQDRVSAIAGTVGSGPEMISASIQTGPGLTGSNAAHDSTINFEMINDPLMTPMLTWSAVVSAIGRLGKLGGDQTVSLDTRIVMEDGRSLEFQNLYAGGSAPFVAGASIYVLLAQLLENHFEPIRLKQVNISIDQKEQSLIASLQNIRVDKERVLPGETVEVTFSVLPRFGAMEDYSLELEIPQDLPRGRVELRVSDARTAYAVERRQTPWKFRPTNGDELVGVLEALPRNNEIVVELFVRRRGATVGTAELPSLPTSMVSVLGSSRHKGQTSLTSGMSVVRKRISLDYVVSGRRALALKIGKKNG